MVLLIENIRLLLIFSLSVQHSVWCLVDPGRITRGGKITNALASPLGQLQYDAEAYILVAWGSDGQG